MKKLHLAYSYSRGLSIRGRNPVSQVRAIGVKPVRKRVRSGKGPGRPRDHSLGLPQIRTCTLNASGSSRCGIAVLHTTGLFRGDTLLRHGVLGVVPTPRPQRGTPFATRGPEGPFPRLNATMGHCDFLTAFSPRFVSFAWRYLGASAFRPRSAADAWPTDHPGVCCTGCSWSGLLQGTVRISQVPVKPVRSFAMFLRPRCDLARLWVQV